MQRLAMHDPGNEYAVIYMWGTTGIGYNVEQDQGAHAQCAAGQLGPGVRAE